MTKIKPVDETDDLQDADTFKTLTAQEVQQLRKKMPLLSVWRVVGVQILVGAVAALLAMWITGRSVVALSVGVARFWRVWDAGPASSAATMDAAGAALSLRFLGGGHGDGCNEEDDAFTLWRRRFHHLTFYGFMLCFASTSHEPTRTAPIAPHGISQSWAIQSGFRPMALNIIIVNAVSTPPPSAIST